MRESHIERKVKNYATSKGLLALKFVSPGTTGVPDHIFHGVGHTFYIEFKAPGEKPSKAQSKMHEKILGKGIPVYVIDDVEKGKELIDDITRNFYPT